MIKIENVTKQFGKDKIAVNNANWTLPEGSITGYIGPNGAGKTTTMKMITGVLKPDSGRILINDIDVAKNPLEAKKQFGFVSDTPDNFLHLKAIEYLNFMGDVYEVSAPERETFISAYAKRFEIEDSLGERIINFSHGMRQKVMVMGALIHSPSIWILDEPLTGLDPQASYQLKEMMREHAKSGKSVLFSTHVLDTAEKLCDNIVIIRKGEIVYQGDLESLKTKYQDDTSLEKIFLEITEDEKNN